MPTPTAGPVLIQQQTSNNFQTLAKTLIAFQHLKERLMPHLTDVEKSLDSCQRNSWLRSQRGLSIKHLLSISSDMKCQINMTLLLRLEM